MVLPMKPSARSGGGSVQGRAFAPGRKSRNFRNASSREASRPRSRWDCAHCATSLRVSLLAEYQNDFRELNRILDAYEPIAHRAIQECLTGSGSALRIKSRSRDETQPAIRLVLESNYANSRCPRR